jgi:nucleoside-diphosphate-sugar epimerase
MNNIVIFGGTGFIGKSLVKKISNDKNKLKIMIHSKEKKNKYKKFRGDILNKKSFEDQIVDNDVIINLIGQYNNNILNFIELNMKGGINLLESCIKKKNIKIILISSVNVYQENLKKPSKETDNPVPKTTYGKIKLLTEELYKIYSDKYNLDVTILRLGNIYGYDKKDGVISNIVKSIKNNKTITITHNGNQIRDYLFIDDAVEGIVSAIKYKKKGFNIFNIASGKKYTTKKIIKNIENIFEKKLLTKIIKDEPDEKCIWIDISKAKKNLKFEAKIDIQMGIKSIKNKIINIKKL